MFSYREMKQAFILFLLGAVVIIALLIPLPQLLPDYFDPWVPDFLTNISLFNYLHLHLNFIISIITATGLFAFVIYLWRKK